MAKTPVSSLLDAVRSQLVVDSDSDGALSPGRSSERCDPVRESELTHAHNPRNRRSIHISRKSNSSSEPFPEYEDSPPMDAADEAYKEAFTAVMQEDIRIHTVEPALEPLSEQPVKKQWVLDEMTKCLSNPQLTEDTRMRFIALTNMVIRLDSALFSGPIYDFLNPFATAEAQSIASCILDFASWTNSLLKELVDRADNVWNVLELILEEDIPEIVRYQRMVRLVSAHLQKTRRLEQHLLQLLLDLYDEWVHNDFLRLRNAQIVQEAPLDNNRLHLTRTLHAIWDVLSRAIENYDIYRASLNAIRDKFFTTPDDTAGSSSFISLRCFQD
ncbi:hypothetical protein N7478_011454 [Penicillium angulare]|uniref:uncharacterized protein n=1 Tax=Penicillium angulare TaxID=116970 RepID=UPI002541FC17|nr:uncharacterized protein N7478_011454 [Penicillium angulare]KAJ5263849.1 hypothetical protein N7478_011454 [Penicillium angulare]